jgi:spore germination cell wall hydrolase CwlJ-like protein
MTLAEVRDAVRRLPARCVLALTVWGEARGEPQAGQVAVAWVIRNRAERRQQSIQRVCLAKWQFSCWWEESANSRALAARAQQMIAGQVLPDPGWLALLQRCHQVLVGGIPDPTGGADHYLTTALHGSAEAPAWAVLMPVVATIGRHTFLRDTGERRA